MSKCIIRTMARRVVQNILGTAFVIACFLVILAIPVGVIKTVIMLFGEQTTALLGAGGISLALMLCVASGLVRLYRQVKKECEWQK